MSRQDNFHDQTVAGVGCNLLPRKDPHVISAMHKGIRMLTPFQGGTGFPAHSDELPSF
ncbi:MAG: hypothetical protein OJF50_004683 [Nitrospira sp.]|nr:hypothetical protein [Nitrospira sp.]